MERDERGDACALVRGESGEVEGGRGGRGKEKE